MFPHLSPIQDDVINCYRLPVSCKRSPPGSFIKVKLLGNKTLLPCFVFFVCGPSEHRLNRFS